MIGALLLPLIFAVPVWVWRWRFGRAFALSRADSRWWRAFAEYCMGYALATGVFMVLESLPATRVCFGLADSRCHLPFAAHLGDWGFAYLFTAGPLGLPALLYAVWEMRRRILPPAPKSAN